MPTKSLGTLTIDNFQGRLTRYFDGDINSGFAKYATTVGNNPFQNPNNLTWFEEPVRIDPLGAVISGYPMAAKLRLENGITYVYMVTTDAKVYKIQVNDPTTYNPNYDNPVLLTTLTINAPTFKYGASINFYGSTEKIYIGHDKGVTTVNFDGTNEAFVGVLGTWTQNVPRPGVEFIGKLEYGNGNNLAEIDNTGTVISYTRLAPAFPIGTQVRDIDVSSDGNYAEIVVSNAVAPDMTANSQDTNLVASSDSYIFQWNGTDDGYTAFKTYISRSLSSNIAFGNYGYSVGYDINGAALFQDGQKLFNLPNLYSPNFNSLFSLGNMAAFCAPESSSAKSDASLFAYGSFDDENPPGLYRLFRQPGVSVFETDTEGDVTYVPFTLSVSNNYFGASVSGYANNLVGSAKIYFSTINAGTDYFSKGGILYKFSPYPTGLGNAIAGVYETQNQLFSKKMQLKQVRLYSEPWVAGNSFTVDLIGSDGNPIPNASKTFTVGSNLTAGADYAWYDPAGAPSYTVGFRISNLGTENFVLSKVEIDYALGGQ